MSINKGSRPIRGLWPKPRPFVMTSKLSMPIIYHDRRPPISHLVWRIPPPSQSESRRVRSGLSPLEGTGFEPSVPRQEKWSMPNSSDQTRVGRTLTLGGGAESSWRAETSNSRSRQKTSVLRPMISARTPRIDDNLGRGTDGSNPLPSSEEMVWGRRRRRWHHRRLANN